MITVFTHIINITNDEKNNLYVAVTFSLYRNNT